jgi:hypothetical protein
MVILTSLFFSHVLEHLLNYSDVILKILPKLNDSCVVYVESQNPESTHFPSRNGTLNFFDDSTQIKPVSF